MGKDQEKIIESCRSEISAIDRQIFSLIKKREQRSIEIGRAKRDLSIPDRDFRREKVVFDQTIALAKELDLPINFATALQKLIIEASLSTQEKERIKSNLDVQKSVLIIGGAGRLGTWLCRFFSDSGHRCFVTDLAPPDFPCDFKPTLDASAEEHDIIVVATPIRASIDILKRLHELKLKKPVIFDVSSVKAPVYSALMSLKAQGAHVTSLHPMFGPSVELLFGKHVIRTSLGDQKADQLTTEIFRQTSLTVLDMSIDEHDEIISILLSLPHLVNIAFVRALSKTKFGPQFLEKFSSPTFSHLLTIAKKVMSENPRLYFEIQALNPHTKNAHQHFEQALDEVMASISQCNEEEFVSIMTTSQQFLQGSS